MILLTILWDFKVDTFQTWGGIVNVSKHLMFVDLTNIIIDLKAFIKV